MLTRSWRALFADPHGSPALIRRLMVEHGSSHWSRYLLSFAMMAVGASRTASNSIHALERRMFSLVSLFDVMS